jgi:hypothetical protein
LPNFKGIKDVPVIKYAVSHEIIHEPGVAYEHTHFMENSKIHKMHSNFKRTKRTAIYLIKLERIKKIFATDNAQIV